MYSQFGYWVVIMSGRPGSLDIQMNTYKWLKDNNVYFDELYMRDPEDKRNDAIVKSEMVDKFIAGRGNIRLWFDDRNRVVDAIRAKGIKVAQVNPGEF
jgi:hypothetical protein